MVKVRFRCREMVKIKYLDSNVVPGSTIYVDPGLSKTQDTSNSAKSGRARSVGCPLLQVCEHLDGLNAEHKFHCWLYSVQLCM